MTALHVVVWVCNALTLVFLLLALRYLRITRKALDRIAEAQKRAAAAESERGLFE